MHSDCFYRVFTGTMIITETLVALIMMVKLKTASCDDNDDKYNLTLLVVMMISFIMRSGCM